MGQLIHDCVPTMAFPSPNNLFYERLLAPSGPTSPPNLQHMDVPRQVMLSLSLSPSP